MTVRDYRILRRRPLMRAEDVAKPHEIADGSRAGRQIQLSSFPTVLDSRGKAPFGSVIRADRLNEINRVRLISRRRVAFARDSYRESVRRLRSE